MKKKGGYGKVVEPDIEISVRAGGTELCVLAFFAANDGVWDVLVGIHDPTDRDALISAFKSAGEAVAKVSFDRDLPAAPRGAGEDPPF